MSKYTTEVPERLSEKDSLTVFVGGAAFGKLSLNAGEEAVRRYNAHATRVKASKTLARKLQDASNAYNAECQGGDPSVAVIDAMRDALDSAALTLSLDTPEAA